MVYAYIRVSTDKQDSKKQRHGIIHKAKTLNLIIDKFIEDSGVSGVIDPNQRALGGCLSNLKEGDILKCSELSRLGRKLFMIMKILEYCMNVGVRIYTVKDGYELADNIQSKVLAFAFGLSAEIEHDLISLRTKEALTVLKSQGRKLGRTCGSKNRRHLLEGKESVIKEMLDSFISKREIARRLGVSVSTLDRFIKTTLR